MIEVATTTAPRAGAVSFRAGHARLVRVASSRLSPIARPVISASSASPEPREAPGPRFATALAGSLAVHAFILALAALAVGVGGREAGSPFSGEPLRARLVVPAPAPEPARPAPPAEPPSRTGFAPSASAPATAPIPVPVPAKAKTPPVAAFEERSAVLPDDGAPVDAALLAVVDALYPGAARETVEFEVLPEPRYPDAARAEHRQLFLRVAAVVKDDGSVEVVEGTFDEPLFGAAVREALAGARARPASGGAASPTRWTVLTFYFESYASGESQRTRYEAR